MKKSGLYITLALFAFPFLASSQLGGVGEEISIISTPPHPRAGSAVTLTIESSSADINSSAIVWTVNGEVAKQGVGAKLFSFGTGGLGSVLVIKASVQTQDSRVLEKEVTLRPADVELLWQTNAYTPPFYRGKALFPYQGTALIAAVPSFVDESGKRMKNSELIYTWSEDGKIDGDSSGYGKNLYAIQGTVPIRAKAVSVEVRTPDDALVASSEVEISPVGPKLLLYENHPLYGILFGRILGGTTSLTGEEIKISAVPFYFETPSRSRILSYAWSLNFSPLPSETKSDIVLRRASEQGGRASLSLEVQNADPKTFQAGRSTVDILMGEQRFGAPR